MLQSISMAKILGYSNARDCETLHYTNFDCNGTASDYHASAGKKFDGNHFLSDDDDKYERMDSILCKSDTVSGKCLQSEF